MQYLDTTNFDKNYGGVIWTNHALERLRDREISQGDAWYTWKKPDQSRYAKAKGAWIYFKTFKDKKIELVATKNENGQWIILSVWDRPVRSVKRHIPKFKKPNIFTILTRILLKKKN